MEPGSFMSAFIIADPQLTGVAADMYAGFSAPYQGLPDEGFNGFRRFPCQFRGQLPQRQRGGPDSALSDTVELVVHGQRLPLLLGLC